MLFALPFALLSCSNSSTSQSENFKVVGSFKASYDTELNTVTYTQVDRDTGAPLTSGVNALSTYENSAGSYYCAIRNHSNNDPGSPNYCMGLIDPDNCTVDYNPTTHVLSFYAKLVNKSNLPDNYDENTNPTGYEYTYPTYYPENTYFFAPFYFTLWSLNWTDSGVVSAVNTNLSGGDCNSSDGMTLAANDTNSNNRYDCLAPDLTFDGYKTNYPGWDFTADVPGGVMAPGDDTGCVQFMQFTLSENFDIEFYFDVLAVQSDASLPSTPTVTTPSDGDYFNSNPITVTVTNCPAGGTVYVDGGLAQGSAACSATTQNVSVSLQQNQENTLSVYYIDGGLQGPAAVVNVKHDDNAPSVVSWVPANEETVVGNVARCIATFNEPLDESTFNAGSGGSCDSGNFVMCEGSTRVPGSISFSVDSTQAIYEPSGTLSSSTEYSCNVQVASGSPTTITDLAGNQLPSESIAFYTGASGEDLTAPYVRSILPVDNTTISPNSSFYVYFSEPVQESSLTATDCGSGSVPNIAVWETNSCVTSGYPTPRPYVISGTTVLNAEGDIATFTPSAAMPTNDCVAISIGSCIRDLAGNALPNTGNFNIGAYSSANQQYHTWNVFYTAPVSDSTGPNLVHVGPMLDATGVRNRIFPFVIFDEPIDVSTIIGDYFYMTEFGDPTHLGLSLQADPTLQMITYETGSNLTTSTKYVITATGAVADTSGNLMPAPQTSNFTINATADTTAPTVVSVSPSNGSTASRCAFIDIEVSEPLSEYTINGSSVTLNEVGVGNVPVDIELSDDGQSIRLIPQSSLNAGSSYRPTISVGVQDRAGNAFASTYNSTTFTAQADWTAPTISHIVPAAESSIAQNGSFAVFFSEPMDRSTLSSSNFTFPAASVSSSGSFTSGSTTVTVSSTNGFFAGMTISASRSGIYSGTTIVSVNSSTSMTISRAPYRSRNATIYGNGDTLCPNFWNVFPAIDGTWAVVNCYNNLSSANAGTVRLTTGVKDRHINSDGGNCESNSGNALGSTFDAGGYSVITSFDTTGPTVSSVSPSDGSTSVSTSVAPTVTFSEPLDPRTVIPTSIFLMDRQGNIINTTLSFSTDGTQVILTPVSALASSGFYYVVATTALRDLGGGNAYDGSGGESIEIPGVLRTCFSTDSTSCP